jgi:cell division GTPase FtsZ
VKLALIGFGQAGGKIVDKFIEYDRRTGSQAVRSAVAVNTAKADLMGLEYVPEENQVLIGQSRVKGHGVGADNELGAELAEEDIDEVQSAIDNVPVHDIDAFLVVAGMGGGTGSGGAPVLAKYLKRIYTEPVYGLGILPARDEGGIYTLNAARSFQTFTREVDNLLVFDNDAWRESGESMGGGYDRINEEIVRRFGILFGAGEIAGGDEVGESVVDSSEIINTLATGGVSTVGYAAEEVDNETGLLSRFTSDDGVDATHATNRLTSLVRKAALGRLTLPCEIESAERSLFVASGPSRYLNRKGIEKGRKWLERETESMEVRGGDYPVADADHVAGVVLLSGVSEVPRVDELQEVAIETQDNIDEMEAESDRQTTELIEDEDGELDPLF